MATCECVNLWNSSSSSVNEREKRIEWKINVVWYYAAPGERGTDEVEKETVCTSRVSGREVHWNRVNITIYIIKCHFMYCMCVCASAVSAWNYLNSKYGDVTTQTHRRIGPANERACVCKWTNIWNIHAFKREDKFIFLRRFVFLLLFFFLFFQLLFLQMVVCWWWLLFNSKAQNNKWIFFVMIYG